MKVLKFGGTSVGTPEKMKSVFDLIQNNEPKFIVLSAMAGTTDILTEITTYLSKNNKDTAKELTSSLEKKYQHVVKELFKTAEYRNKAMGMVLSHFNHIRSFFHKFYSLPQRNSILAQGELISTALFYYLLEENNIQPVLLPALNFMRIDRAEEPDEFYIKQNLERELQSYQNQNLFITQGYICRNVFGEVDNLKRGGSDYTASLIAAAIEAEELQIWTDIDGFHNNDPRYVKNSYPVRNLSFDEAAELAYFGANILHPSSVLPCKIKDIPVRLKNTMNHDDEGTLISNSSTKTDIKAVAAKDGITAIKIKSNRMLLAYGFIRKVFEVFEIYHTPVDVITTSEVALSVTIDKTDYLDQIIEDLKKLSTVEIESHQSIICVVGDLIAEKKGVVAEIFNALSDIPVRLISYGGSHYNITLLVKTKDKVKTLEALNRNLFNHDQ
ncbi:MAG: aspartate kinase [Bacteroidales bacterium]